MVHLEHVVGEINADVANLRVDAPSGDSLLNSHPLAHSMPSRERASSTTSFLQGRIRSGSTDVCYADGSGSKFRASAGPRSAVAGWWALTRRFQAPKPKLSHARRTHPVRMDRYQPDAAEQTAWGSACKRPSRAQRHPLGPPVRCFTPWGRAGVTDRIMAALAASHNAAVQMIDTSVVHVHRRSTYLGEQSRNMGRSRGGLTSKIHAVVDSNGLPFDLALTPGEANNNWFCSILFRALLPLTILLRGSWIRRRLDRRACPRARSMGEHSAQTNCKDPICFICIARAT